MVKRNLVKLSVILSSIGLLLIGGAYLAFTDASKSFNESMEDSEAGCESFFGFCWFLPSGSFGCGSCLLGILLVGLVVPIMFGGVWSGLVGLWSVPDQVVVVAPLSQPAPPVNLVVNEFAELERELEDMGDDLE